MNALGPVHILFLRQCAAEDKHTHEAPKTIEKADLDQMVREGLLIEYRGVNGNRYTCTQSGSRLALSFGDHPELEKIAVAYLVGKGYDEAQALEVVQANGAELVLRAKKQEEAPSSGQREVAMATEGGKAVFKPIKSL